jgi:coproporphyrinogen III oxidase-like Fe-S oxidoreductase
MSTRPATVTKKIHEAVSTAPQLDNEHELLRQLESFVLQHDIEHLLRDDKFGIDPKHKEQYWVDIYPRLEPGPCDSNQMLDSWLSRERRRIVFLYLHVPFCVKKCDFCYFHVTTDLKQMDQYVAVLEKEMLAYLKHSPRNTQVGDLYFGGGTASLLTAAHLRRLYDGVFEYIDPGNFERRTLELHPRTMRNGLHELALSGHINRASMGIQTFSKKVIEASNRIWVGPDRIKEVCSAFREAGVKHINVDFMSGLYLQTVDDVMADLREIDQLISQGFINSVSLYPRSFNKSSIFFEKEVINAEVLLEKFRIQQLYRLYFEQNPAWVEHPRYLFAPKSVQPPQPSACVWDSDVQALGFGNSARSYFDHANFLNVTGYEDYMKAMSAGEGATVQYHNLTVAEMKRRHLMFGAKRGYVDFAFPAPLVDEEEAEFHSVNEYLSDNGLVEYRADRIELTALGALLIEYIYKRYDQMFRN